MKHRVIALLLLFLTFNSCVESVSVGFRTNAYTDPSYANSWCMWNRNGTDDKLRHCSNNVTEGKVFCVPASQDIDVLLFQYCWSCVSYEVMKWNLNFVVVGNGAQLTVGGSYQEPCQKRAPLQPVTLNQFQVWTDKKGNETGREILNFEYVGLCNV